jgi:Tfp pilus assembly protein PilV
VTAKIGDAIAVANERGHKSNGTLCASGGVVNSDAVWVTSDTWEAEISARRQLQHNLDGRVAARFVAREVEAGVSYHFTQEFKGWHVNAKTILSPQGINTPEFTLHHVWDF